MPGGTGNYVNPIVNISDLTNPGRGDQLYLVVRQISSQVGTVDSCTTMSGNVQVNSIDNHIIGCRRAETQLPCDPTETSIADAVRPQYVIGASATFSSVKLSTGSKCGVVRNTVP